MGQGARVRRQRARPDLRGAADRVRRGPLLTLLTVDRRLALVAEQSALLAEAAAAAGPDAPVPSCPGWTVRDLVAHHGGVLRTWAAVVAAGEASAPPAFLAADDAERPWEPMRDDWRPWYETARATFAAAVRAAGPDAPAWAWWAAVEQPTAGTILRHQVQEACVHRWDAQAAAGLAPDPLPADAAVEGVAEVLTVNVPAEPPPWSGPRTAVRLEPAGAPPWLLVADGTLTARPAAPGDAVDAVLSGPASDLVLVLYERLPPTALRVEGDVEAAVRLLG